LLLATAGRAAAACDEPGLRAAYERLRAEVDACRPVPALSLADSLLLAMEDRQATDCERYRWIHYEKGETLEFLQRFEDALATYYPLATAAEADEQWALLAETHISIARTHEAIGRPADCRRHLHLARELIGAHGLDTLLARFAVRNASYHRLYDQPDSARYYAALAIEYGRRFGVQRAEVDGHLLAGMLALSDEAAIGHLRAATRLFLDRGDYNGAAYQAHNIARRYLQLGEPGRAHRQLDTAFLYAHGMPADYPGYHGVLETLYALRSQAFEAEGLIDSAYASLRHSIAAGALARTEVDQALVSQQEIAFNIAKEQEKLAFERQRARNLRWGLALVAALLAVLAGVALSNVRRKRYIARQKDELSAKNDELSRSFEQQSLLLSEIHHRVKNNLQLVVSLFTLKGQKATGDGLEQQLTDMADKVYSIGLIHEQLYRAGAYEEVHLPTYFGELARHFQSIQRGGRPLAIALDIAELALNLETVMPLGIICAELFSNSMKYGCRPDGPLRIQLSVTAAGDQYRLCYRDNGPGYPDGALLLDHDSLGGMLVYSMTRQLQGEAATGNEDGAVFTLV
ncbi:MAG: hypothetical protein KDC54_00185, partial [Lewinella sp.]|nr:hypothetical protein [Lewinella sp.]